MNGDLKNFKKKEKAQETHTSKTHKNTKSETIVYKQKTNNEKKNPNEAL